MEVYLYNEIGDGGIDPRVFIDELNAAVRQGPVTIRINSRGGNVSAAQTIVSGIHRLKVASTAEIDGMAGSAASFIAVAPKRTYMAENALMFVHSAHVELHGNSAELRKTAGTLDKMDLQIATAYGRKSGRPVSFWQDIMASEAYFNAAEALDLGLIDGITQPSAIAAKLDHGVYAKRPERITALLRTLAPRSASSPASSPAVAAKLAGYRARADQVNRMEADAEHARVLAIQKRYGGGW